MIDVSSSTNLLDGVVHHVEVNIHLLYHYLTLFLDNQDVPVFALDAVRNSCSDVISRQFRELRMFPSNLLSSRSTR